MQFSFRKPHFWHPPNFAKTLFWHTVALFVFLKMPKKHYKNGEKQWRKNLDHFLTLNLDHFLTLKPPNLGPDNNFTAYIYIHLKISRRRSNKFTQSWRQGSPKIDHEQGRLLQDCFLNIPQLCKTRVYIAFRQLLKCRPWAAVFNG